MFEIGFLELALIGIVALLVVGPERMPQLVRTTGFWVGKFRRMVSQVRDDVEKEIRAEELKRTFTESTELNGAFDALESAKSEVESMASDLKSSTAPGYESHSSDQSPGEGDMSLETTTSGDQSWRDEPQYPVDEPVAQTKSDEYYEGFFDEFQDGADGAPQTARDGGNEISPDSAADAEVGNGDKPAPNGVNHD